MKEIEIITREYDPKTDDDYIYATWIKRIYNSEGYKNHIKFEHFKWQKGKEIKELLNTQNVKTACFKQEPSVIVGYICVVEGEIKNICIKKDLLEEGIDRLLINSMKDKINGSAEEYKRS